VGVAVGVLVEVVVGLFVGVGRGVRVAVGGLVDVGVGMFVGVGSGVEVAVGGLVDVGAGLFVCVGIGVGDTGVEVGRDLVWSTVTTLSVGMGLQDTAPLTRIASVAIRIILFFITHLHILLNPH